MAYVLNFVYLALMFATLPYWLYKAATTGKYRRGLAAKFLGRSPRLAGDLPVVWIHAVSVGEVLLLRPLLERLSEQVHDRQIVLSTTTDTGYAVARDKYPQLVVFYAPMDFSWAVRRVFAALDPELLVLTELELWPNLLLEARRRAVPVAVVNARLSERSHRGYRRVRRLLHPALAAVRWWGAQSDAVAARLADLTAGLETTIQVTGSMKYDGALQDRDNPGTQSLRRLLGFQDGERIFVAGSTQGDEEQIVVEAFLAAALRYPEFRLVVVPRHPERFAAVAETLAKAGAPFVRRTRCAEPRAASAPVTLLDTMGELTAAWGLADFGFVGGSIACGRGGQSMIEPAGYGVPTCFGPETWNFHDAVHRLLLADAAIRLTNPGQLLSVLTAWLDDPAAAARQGANARRFIQSQQGAASATFEALAFLQTLGRSARKCA